MSTQINNMLVAEVMLSLERSPWVHKNAILKEAIEKMGKTQLGIACIIDIDNTLLGILTDGDIRRKLLKIQKPFSAFLIDDALDHAICKPVVIKADDSLFCALDLMEEKLIWDLPVINNEGKLVGLLHLHPVVKTLLKITK